MARLWSWLRGLFGRQRRVAEGLRDGLVQVRQNLLDETELLESDGKDLAARIRRNTQRGRGVLAGERPL